VKAGSDREEVQTSVCKWFLTRKYGFLEVSEYTTFIYLGAGTGSWP